MPRRLAALAAAAALVSATGLLRPAAAAPTFEAVFAGKLSGGGEPSIASGPGAYLYVSYPSEDGMSFVRSRNGGRTWTKGGFADDSSHDTTVNVDSSGAVYQSNLNDNLQGDVWKSFDRGATWKQKGSNGTTGDATGQPLFVDRQWTDAYIPPGKGTDQARVYIAYHDFVPSQVWVNASTDGGRTFGPPVDAIVSPEAHAASFCNTVPGGLRVAQAGPHAGRIYVAWVAGDVATNLATGCNITQLNTFHSVWVAWSDDEGATWTDQLVFDGGFGHDTSALFADLTLDRAGNPYVAFADNIGPQWDVYLMASFDGGKTWNGKSDGTGTPYKVSTDRGTHFFPAVAAGDPGRVHLTWIATSKVVDTLPYGKPFPGGAAGATWYLYAAQSLDVRSEHPTWAVTKAAPSPVHRGDVCTLGLFCAAGEPLGANRDLLDFIDVVVDGRGMAHIAYTDDASKPAGIYVANQTGGASVLAGRVARARLATGR